MNKMKAIIYTHKGDSQEELTDIKRQLDEKDISYVFGKGLISESYVPIVEIEGELCTGAHSLFLYLYHRKE